MSESKDIAEHLEGFANDAANPGAPILSRYFGGILPAVDLTRSDLLRAIAEIRALRSALATALALAELHCGNLDPAATAEIGRARALLEGKG